MSANEREKGRDREAASQPDIEKKMKSDGERQTDRQGETQREGDSVCK